MRYILSPAMMRDTERAFIAASGVSGDTLMERAARHILGCMLELLETNAPCNGEAQHCSPFSATSRAACDGQPDGLAVLGNALANRVAAFAAGPGNNGGDAWAAARLYCALGGRAYVVSLCDPAELKGDARLNYERARDIPGLEIRSMAELNAVPAPDIWVDALFGTGLNRPLSGDALTLMQRMARDRATNPNCKLLAVDIPSGLNGETGVNGGAIPADMTVTFQYAKLGHLIADGQDVCGELRVADIGIDGAYLPANAPTFAGINDVIIPKRLHNSHKGNYGQLLLVAGSVGFAGAAIMCANAAARAGVGLLTVACPESIWQVIQAAVPSAMVRPLPDENGAISKAAIPALVEALRGKSAYAVGPGVTRRFPADALRLLLESELPGVIDADGLNVLSTNRDLTRLLRPRHVLTPHIGELTRLLERPSACSLEDARELAGLGCTALVKGPCTIVIDGESGAARLCASGTPGMARGGSGDSLTGIIAALLARSHDAFTSAWQGAILHGEAGRAAERRFSQTSMLASDLPSALSDVFCRLEAR